MWKSAVTTSLEPFVSNALAPTTPAEENAIKQSRIWFHSSAVMVSDEFFEINEGATLVIFPLPVWFQKSATFLIAHLSELISDAQTSWLEATLFKVGNFV